MKEQKINKILYIVAILIIIIGIIMYYKKGFNIELLYSNRQEVLISDSNEMDVTKIQEIAGTVLENRSVKVVRHERFGNALEVISTSISEDEKNNLVDKINEECGTNISKDDTKIISVSNTQIRDILKLYILPGIITFAIIVIYFVIMYHKIGLTKVLLKSIFTPVIAELTYYSLIVITRAEFGRITNSIAIGIYVLAIGVLAIKFQNEKEKLPKKEEREND